MMACPGMVLTIGSVFEVVVEEVADEAIVELPIAWPHPLANRRIGITAGSKIYPLLRESFSGFRLDKWFSLFRTLVTLLYVSANSRF
jgi:hypothetical protein